MALQHLPERPDRGRQRAAEVRMPLRESDPPAAGRGRRPDRQALLLREEHRRVPAAARVDIRAGDHRGILRVGEAVRDRAHRRRVRHASPGDRARDRVPDVAVVNLGPPIVHRDRDERGALRG